MAQSTDKKRPASTTLNKNTQNQHKKSKLEAQSIEDPSTASGGGLFDDLDEEMDPNVLDSVMEQLDNSDQNDSDDDTSSTTSSIPEVDSNVLPSDTEDQQDVAKNDPPSLDKPLAGKFRDHYMGQMTVAFGSELDTIRQEPGFTPSRLNVLIDSLEAGMAIFSDLEKTIALANDT